MDYAGFGSLRAYGAYGDPVVRVTDPADKDAHARVRRGGPRTPSAHPRVREAHLPVIGQAQQGSLPYAAQAYAQRVAEGLAPDPAAPVPALNGYSYGEIVALGAARMFSYGDELNSEDDGLSKQEEVAALLAKAEEVASSPGAQEARATIQKSVAGSSNLLFWGALGFIAWRVLR